MEFLNAYNLAKFPLGSIGVAQRWKPPSKTP